MIFKSHLISMVIFAAIVSVVLALIRYQGDKKLTRRYAVKFFLKMTGGVIAGAWILYFL